MGMDSQQVIQNCLKVLVVTLAVIIKTPLVKCQNDDSIRRSATERSWNEYYGESNFRSQNGIQSQSKSSSFSTFSPENPNVFGYHFVPYEKNKYPFAYFYPNDERYAQQTETASIPSPEPILYNYSAKSSDSSEEFDSSQKTAVTEAEYVVIGVENLVFFGNTPSGQHITVVVIQGSGILDSVLENESIKNSHFSNSMEPNFSYNSELRIHSQHKPENEELADIHETLKSVLSHHVD